MLEVVCREGCMCVCVHASGWPQPDDWDVVLLPKKTLGVRSRVEFYKQRYHNMEHCNVKYHNLAKDIIN